jgi:hypothetical protein
VSFVAIAGGAFMLSLAVTLGAPAADSNTFVMKIAFATLDDVLHQYAKNYAAAVEKDSRGRIKAASQLGAIQRQAESVQFGAGQKFRCNDLALDCIDERFEVLASPGLVTSMTEGQRVAADPARSCREYFFVTYSGKAYSVDPGEKCNRYKRILASSVPKLPQLRPVIVRWSTLFRPRFADRGSRQCRPARAGVCLVECCVTAISGCVKKLETAPSAWTYSVYPKLLTILKRQDERVALAGLSSAILSAGSCAM